MVRDGTTTAPQDAPARSKHWTTTITATVAQKRQMISNPVSGSLFGVEDASGRTSFTLFNKEAEEIIDTQVEMALNDLQQDSNAAATPPIIRNIIGKRCVFDVRISAYNTDHGYEECTVYHISYCEPVGRVSGDTHMDASSRKKQKTH